MTHQISTIVEVQYSAVGNKIEARKARKGLMDQRKPERGEALGIYIDLFLSSRLRLSKDLQNRYINKIVYIYKLEIRKATDGRP